MLVSRDQHEQTPRLEDFFWTGSGDGPPPPPEPALATPAQPSTPLVHTTTVLATAVTDKTTGECILNCGEPIGPDSLEPEIPEDRRYWLLTVIQGSTPDSLQLKLARLYQKAFLRQQERHLGIIKSLDAPTSRRKHDVHSFVVNKGNSINQIGSYSSDTPFNNVNIISSMTRIESFTDTVTNIKNTVSLHLPNDVMLKVYPNEDLIQIDNVDPSSMRAEIKATRISDVESWILAAPTIVVRKREIRDRENEDIKEDLIDIPLESDSGNETLLFKREIIKPEQQPPVQVHIQNITESPETGSVQIVYVVLVGGRAVPAAVAARDMRLVRDAEVARELGAVVTTKAEPYLKAAEDLEGQAETKTGVHGTELWALAVGATVALLLLLILFALLCLAHRRKAVKSAASLRAYRNELMREAERNQLKQVHEEKDGRLISVVSPSRTRPSSTLLPIYRAASASRGNIVEPLSRILEPVSVRHLDIDTPVSSPKRPKEKDKNVIPRRQMPSQLVRLGSIDKDPGVIGPLPPSPTKSPSSTQKTGPSRMRQRFNELMDDAFTLFGSAASGSKDTTGGSERETSGDKIKPESEQVTQARNDNVKLPGSPYTAMDTVRGKSAGDSSNVRVLDNT
ncbi:unnamed protein product [Diatraea saccharalis]|uniref:Uncharacterized protein n=1 Tax=Diatraea saccharalis TaxID=40085 RepID=A0A9N9N1H3_9NEOP|nr:unnamed protein product [Diatraea saccharalis]